MFDEGGRRSGPDIAPVRGESSRLRPRYSPAELAALLWRERLTMLAVFAVILALGTGVALMLPKTYAARSSLLVQLGQEYVYVPRAGDAARGTVPQKDQVVQSEAEILGSDELKRRVIAAVGLQVVSPKLARAWPEADEAGRRRLEGAAVKILRRGLSIGTAPDSNVVRLEYRHDNPQAAARILNALVESYLTYRREVFVDATSPALARERDAFEQRLRSANDAYEGFLQSNGLADFATEKASVAATWQSTFDERFKTEAQLGEVRRQLDVVAARERQTPAEVEIQRDLDLSAPAELIKLRTQRQDLLSRYLPGSIPIKELDAKIASLEALISSGRAVGEKDKRLGVNPVRQGLESRRIELEAQAAALSGRRDALSNQLADLSSRQARLVGLEPQFQSLAAEREVLQSDVRAFTAQEEEARASGDIARASDGNIRVVERAAPPVEGKSLKRIVFGLAFLFAAFTAVCAGLIRVFLRKGFATARSASRALDLPVLASAGVKA
jgi:uncharacterized protein involved in exopolysaccharide biosynthesis